MNLTLVTEAAAARPAGLLRRGVYLAPFLSPEGEPLYVAIDGGGRCVQVMSTIEGMPEPILAQIMACFIEVSEEKRPELGIVR